MVMLYVVLLPSEINYELATITIIPYNRYIIKVPHIDLYDYYYNLLHINRN